MPQTVTCMRRQFQLCGTLNPDSMTSTDRIALLFSLVVILGAAFIAGSIFENMAHLEDEFAYIWQAKTIAGSDLTLPSPDYSSSFLIPFVVDHQGLRFAKYPLGWPVVLSLGIRTGLRNWVNPILAGIAIWFVYKLAKRLFNEKVGILSVVLLGTSPLFLIQAGTLLSHVWSLVLVSAFSLFWFDCLDADQQTGLWFKGISAGVCLGLVGLTRPLTMAAISIPFLIHGIFQMIRGNRVQRRVVFLIGGSALFVTCLHFVWQWALTGDLLTNPYTLWWPYDKYGFGPGYGVVPGGHSPLQGWWNTKHSLHAGLSDLFGWGLISWLFLPFGLIKGRKSSSVYLLLGIFVSLVILYSVYWIGSWLLGPRYYFEALPGLTIITALGICWLAGWDCSKADNKFEQDRRRYRPLLATGIIAALIFGNLYFYLPSRLKTLQGLYGIERSDLAAFESTQVQDLTPALVIVHSDDWMPYGSLLELESSNLDSPWIFAWSIGLDRDQKLTESYWDQRTIIHYYPDEEPFKLFISAHK